MVESVSVLLVSIAAVLTAIDQISIVLTTKKLWKQRHGGVLRTTMSGSRVCMDGKRCTQTNHWQTFPSAV